MKTIVVATDFSLAARNAALYAVNMAHVIKADVLLLYVYQLQINYVNAAMPVNMPEWQEDAENTIKELKDLLEQHMDGQVRVSTEIRMGSFVPELNTLCTRVKPYAVVIGSTGKTAAEKIFLGSNAMYIMKHLEWPAIMIPPSAKFSKIARIGLACDLNNVTYTVPVAEINRLVEDFNAELYILNIGKAGSYNPETVFESKILGDMLGKAKPTFHFIPGTDTDQGIMDFSEINDIDLLVVLPKHHSLLEKITHKSHTKQFVLHSQLPLMTLHAIKST